MIRQASAASLDLCHHLLEPCRRPQSLDCASPPTQSPYPMTCPLPKLQDARQAASLEEALWRAQAFADAGADILFIDALESVDEMRAFTSLGGRAALLPKMANNLEGGGKTPVLSLKELQGLGFKVRRLMCSLQGATRPQATRQRQANAFLGTRNW